MEPHDATGVDAARARVAALLDRLARVELQVIVVAPPDATRLAARDRARDAAITAGRAELLDEATEAARDTAIRTFARGGFSGTWAATDMAISVVRAGDRVAAAAALEEAAIAEVVEDLVDEETLDILRSTLDELVSLRDVPSPGALSSLGTPAAVAIRGPIQVAILVGFVVFAVVVGFAISTSVGGIIVVVAGVAAVATLARRRPQRDP